MAKVALWLDNSANIHSCRETGTLDTVKDLGLRENEWEEMSEEKRLEIVKEWANEYIEYIEYGYRSKD